MAVEYLYCTEGDITALAGQLALDLRLDDSADSAADMLWAQESGTSEVDTYLSRYSQAACAESDWVQKHATWFALRTLCMRRLNDVPESVEKEWARREKQLMLVQQRKMDAPRLAHTRRPAAVTNYTVDLRRFNNQVRVDKTKSTGIARDYNRPTDPSAPDDR